MVFKQEEFLGRITRELIRKKSGLKADQELSAQGKGRFGGTGGVINYTSGIYTNHRETSEKDA